MNSIKLPLMLLAVITAVLLIVGVGMHQNTGKASPSSSGTIEITGKVSYENGTPAAGAQIMPRIDGEKINGTIADSNGTYKLNIPAYYISKFDLVSTDAIPTTSGKLDSRNNILSDGFASKQLTLHLQFAYVEHGLLIKAVKNNHTSWPVYQIINNSIVTINNLTLSVLSNETQTTGNNQSSEETINMTMLKSISDCMGVNITVNNTCKEKDINMDKEINIQDVRLFVISEFQH